MSQIDHDGTANAPMTCVWAGRVGTHDVALFQLDDPGPLDDEHWSGEPDGGPPEGSSRG